MFRRSNETVLRLEIDGESCSFPSVAEFAFSLGGRTGLPRNRIVTILGQRNETLLREAGAINKVARRLTQFLATASDGSASISAFLQRFEPSLISQDHGWRTLFAALAQFDSSVDPYKRVALAKYNQYLAAREEVTRTVYASRQDEADTAEGPVHPVNGAGMTIDLGVDPSGCGASLTLGYDRLPKGETIELAVDPSEPLPVLIVKHRCEIRGGKAIHFVDPTGRETVLRPGKHIVGRDARSEVTIPTDRRDISRKHLIVEALEGSVVRLTDISSLGTYIPPRYLDKTGS